MNKMIMVSILTIFPILSQAQTDNETLGSDAGFNLTTGDYNVFIGDDAATRIDSESRNTIIGYRACAGTLDDGSVSGFPDLGDGSGLPLTTADCDPNDAVIIGYHANMQGTGGLDNVIIGSEAGEFNSATDSTFVGSSAGRNNTTGVDNVFIGEEAGLNNTDGDDNVFVGEDAGYNNTLGDDNTALGSSSLRSNEIGRYNTAVGNEAGYDIGGGVGSGYNAARNTVVGNNAGIDIGQGVANTCIGDNACPNTEYADFNTFIGVQAGFDNNRTNVNNDNNAQRNTGLGSYAGYTNREGTDNVWIGAFSDSGQRLSGFSHSDEVSLMQTGAAWSPGDAGVSAGADNTIYRTTVLGAFASAGEDDSIAIGYNSRSDNVNSIAIGTNATATFTNSITLGNNASAKANNTVVIGNDDTVAQIPNIDAVTTLGNISYRYADVISNQVSVNAPLTSPALIELAADAGSSNDDVWTIGAADGGDFSISSFATGVDVNLLTITNTGDAVLSGDLTLNSDERLKKNIKSIKGALDLIGGIDGKTYQWKASEKSQAMQYGLIAQQLESVLPQLVKDKEDGMKTVNYQGLIPVLVNAVNELSAEKQKQDNRIANLEDRLERQNSLIEALMEKLD